MACDVIETEDGNTGIQRGDEQAKDTEGEKQEKQETKSRQRRESEREEKTYSPERQ